MMWHRAVVVGNMTSRDTYRSRAVDTKVQRWKRSECAACTAASVHVLFCTAWALHCTEWRACPRSKGLASRISGLLSLASRISGLLSLASRISGLLRASPVSCKPVSL
ncbi:hypothetical protein KC19_6G217100 [Ceratodon purpureus]|uniref:Uncharacterized protein n=1 Tax=Ceratodon purpureus TaxID=3225 RepID=A0A8T0HK96_CERPU|nr:hypothetical protein KC19_6G217100 [Ceratodon purpureus]